MGTLTDEQDELLQHIKKNFDGEKLTPWEFSFTTGILDKYKQYGKRLMLSKKQLEKLVIIGAALT